MADSLTYTLNRQEHKQYAIEKALYYLLTEDMSLKDTADALTEQGVLGWHGKPFNKWSLHYLLRSESISVEDAKREYALASAS